MKPLFEGQKLPDKRKDMGDMPIANCKFDCSKCALKEVGCIFKVNTLNCMVAQKRLKKIQNEENEETEENLENEEKQSIKEFLDGLATTSDGGEGDD